MPTIPNTEVKWITSEMRGAPVLNRQPGTLVAVLDALLITGWGLTTALSVNVVDGLATAMLTPGETFLRDAVVLIGGATPSALNGEARVLSMSNSSITWATDAPDGAATGTITIRYAPQSAWQKVFTAANRAVYRSTHAHSSGHYLSVNDTGLNSARVVGYEAMTDIDSGVGGFPLSAQLAGGGYWHRSTRTNDNPSKYRIAADTRLLIVGLMASADVALYQNTPAFGFGDPDPISPAGDAWSTVLSFSGTVSSTSVNSVTTSNHLCSSSSSGSASNFTSSATVAPRGASGLGGAVLIDTRSVSGTNTSGADNYFGAGPSAIDGKILMSRVFIKEQGTQMPPRAWVPGVRYLPQDGLAAVIQDMDMLDGSGDDAGHRFAVLCCSSNYNSTPTGRYLLDITGPWRD